jgi:hypothetical protein
MKRRTCDSSKSLANNSFPLLWERVVAGNGTFVKAKRDIFEVCLRESDEIACGVEWIQPYFRLSTPIKVPESILNNLLLLSRQAVPCEILFYLQFTESEWKIIIPEQVATPTTVTPLSSPFKSGAAEAAIEIHSHVDGEARFSATDDADETGLRLYAVIGNINSRPALRLRVGIYGRAFCEIPATTVFELPTTINDALVWRGNESMTY